MHQHAARYMRMCMCVAVSERCALCRIGCASATGLVILGSGVAVVSGVSAADVRGRGSVAAYRGYAKRCSVCQRYSTVAGARDRTFCAIILYNIYDSSPESESSNK